jgi:pimeloyl-ACP methyl ester carboxylesterase
MEASSPVAAAGASIDPQANHLDQAGSRKRVLRVWQTAYLGGPGKHVQYMQFGKDGLRPLIWLHSIDYPMAPPWGLCVDAADKGFSVVSVRRPGFGETSGATDTDEEVRILSAFLDAAGFENAVLIVEGTARPAGLKLAMSNPRIAFTVLARPAYAAGSFGDLEPWFRDLILQTLKTHAGASLSLAAITQIGRRSGHEWLYGKFLKGAKDPDFVRGHERDLAEAWQCVCAMRPEIFQRELRALEPDPALTPGALAGFPGLAVIGAETHPEWRAGFEARSAELGIPTALLPVGSLFALYQNSELLLELIADRC